MSRRTASGAKSAAGEATAIKASQDKQQKLLAEDVGHFSMLRALHLADYITELNGFCGFMSILSSLTYALGPPHEQGAMWVALTFMPFGLMFDFLDGRVARWRHKSSLMGQELDSLADLLSFGAAPATAAFALGLRTPLDRVCLAFFVLCGLTRLARFNVTVATLPKDASGKSRYFEGFPIPTSLGLVAGMAVCLRLQCVLDKVPLGTVRLWGAAPPPLRSADPAALGLHEWALVHPAVAVFVVWGCLMVSRTVRVPKP